VTRAPGQRDQRKFDRRPAEIAVSVRAAGSMVAGGIRLDSLDVSEGGAFLRSALLFEIGEVLHLEIPIPGGPVIKATGKVVRVSRGRSKGQAPGMGIEFTRLAMSDRRAISSFLSHLIRQNPASF
jgi:Tfp pilus assembly protein PilZ